MTITLTREEAHDLLAVLEELNRLSIGKDAICLPAEIDYAMEILEARLSAPEPEPVAGYRWEKGRTPPSVTFTAPPQPEPPCKTGSQCIGGKCPQCVVSEPVAWMNESDMGRTDWKVWAHGKPTATMPLYAAQPKREWKYDPMTGEPLIDGWPLYSGLPKPWQGLTDEEIKSLLWETRVDNLKFARVIETLLREKNAS